MRIGFFADEYLPRLDGVITSMTNLAHGLEQLGHQIFFIVPSYPNTTKQSNIIRLPSTPVPLSDNVRMMLPSQRSATAVKRLKLDIIHSHTPFVAAQFSRRLARDQDLPHVTTFHTLLPVLLDYYPIRTRSYFPAVVATIADILASADLNKYKLPSDSATSGFKRQAWKWTGAFLDSVDYVISPSEHFGVKLEALGAETPISVVPNSIDLGIFPARGYQSHAPLKLVAVGRLSPEKRQSELIKAMTKLEPNRYKLKLIGDGPERARLTSLINQLKLRNVELTGSLTPPQVRQELYKSDVGLLASAGFDNQPMTVLEYLAAGLPVVYCDGELTEGLTPKNSQLSGQSASDFATTITTLTPSRLKVMSMAGQKSAKRFGQLVVARQVEAIYKKLI